MSVYIKGIEMPKNCYVCPFCDYVSARCDAVKGTPYTPPNRYEARAEWCPLVPVPPHGRLIDADALNYTMLYKENWMSGTGVEAPAVWRKDIDDAPTIIPAEGGE